MSCSCFDLLPYTQHSFLTGISKCHRDDNVVDLTLFQKYYDRLKLLCFYKLLVIDNCCLLEENIYVPGFTLIVL